MPAICREAHIPPPPPAFFRSKSSSIGGGHVGRAGLLSVKPGLFWVFFLPFSTSLLSVVAAFAGVIVGMAISGVAWMASVKSLVAYPRMRLLPGCLGQALVSTHGTAATEQTLRL